MAKKKITLESVAKSIAALAGVTAKGFESVQKEFKGVHQKFKEVNKKFGGIHKEIDDLAAMTARGFAEVHSEFLGETTATKAHVKKLGLEMHEEFDESHKRLGLHHDELTNIVSRVKALEIHTRIHREDK